KGEGAGLAAEEPDEGPGEEQSTSEPEREGAPKDESNQGAQVVCRPMPFPDHRFPMSLRFLNSRYELFEPGPFSDLGLISRFGVCGSRTSPGASYAAPPLRAGGPSQSRHSRRHTPC